MTIATQNGFKTRQYTVGSCGEVASFFGVTAQAVDYWRKQGMPGEPKKWPLDQITRWLRSHGPWRATGPAGQAGSGDPLMAGASDGSEGLERYRQAKASMAELDLATKRGLLIDRESLREALSRLAAPLRTAGEQLTKRYGDDARQILDEGLEEFQRSASDLFPTEPADAADQPAAG